LYGIGRLDILDSSVFTLSAAHWQRPDESARAERARNSAGENCAACANSPMLLPGRCSSMKSANETFGSDGQFHFELIDSHGPHSICREVMMKSIDTPTAVGAPTLGWSKFALSRHKPGTGYAFFTGYTDADVVDLVRRNWHAATPGGGEKDLKRKVVVPIPAENFYCTSVPLQKDMALHSEIYQHNQHFAIKNIARAKAVPAKFVNVVCFSADAVAKEMGQRSCDLEWEIIVVLSALAQHEPMHFLSMARNVLETPGGESKYSAKEFAESIHYWSQRVQVSGGDES